MRARSLNNSNFNLGNVICRNQNSAPKSIKSDDVTHEKLRHAVRAWAAGWRSKEAVAAEIVAACHDLGGEGFGFHANHSRNAQKIFRWIDGDSPRYRRYVTALAPYILDVLPLDYRTGLAEPDERLARVAVATKECAEAHRAVLLNAPNKELEKEITEGIESLVRLAPPDRWDAVMTSAAVKFRS
jgi:hypothetical protein